MEGKLLFRNRVSVALAGLVAASALSAPLVAPVVFPALSTTAIADTTTEAKATVIDNIDADLRSIFHDPSGYYWSVVDDDKGSVKVVRLDQDLKATSYSVDISSAVSKVFGTFATSDGRYIVIWNTRPKQTVLYDTIERTATPISGISGEITPSGIVEGPAGTLYVLHSKGIVPVNLATATAGDSLNGLSTAKYPNYKTGVYLKDQGLVAFASNLSNNRGIYFYNPSTATSFFYPTSGLKASDGGQANGVIKSLVYDPTTQTVYINMASSTSSSFKANQLFSLSVATRTAGNGGVGIELANGIFDLVAVPGSSQLLATVSLTPAGEDAGKPAVNQLLSIDPGAGKVSTLVDFNAVGATNPAASGNTWSVFMRDAHTAVVTHPFGDSSATPPVNNRVSIVTLPAVAAPEEPKPVEPEQPSVPENHTEPTNSAWPGPQQETTQVPAGAHTITDASFTWDMSEYAQSHQWKFAPYGSSTSQSGGGIEIAKGTGWRNGQGETTITWTDGFRVQPYPSLVPYLWGEIGNLKLTVAADGSGKLSGTVRFNGEETEKPSQWATVPIAQFAAGTLKVTEKDGKISITGTPRSDYSDQIEIGEKTGRALWAPEFVNEVFADGRAWFLETGSRQDAAKVASALTFTGELSGTAQPETPAEPNTPAEPETSDDQGTQAEPEKKAPEKPVWEMILDILWWILAPSIVLVLLWQVLGPFSGFGWVPR